MTLMRDIRAIVVQSTIYKLLIYIKICRYIAKSAYLDFGNLPA